MRSAFRAAAVAVALALYAAPAFAVEPLVMFLLNAASQMIQAAAERPAPPAPPPPTYPGTTVRPAELQEVIDSSFGYLGERQRREIFDSFNRELLKPKNAALRGAMIQYFIDRALQVRAAQLSLARLSHDEKATLAASFGRQLAALPPQQRGKLRALVEEHLLPVPDDLNAMLLAELAGHAPRDAAAGAPAAQR